MQIGTEDSASGISVVGEGWFVDMDMNGIGCWKRGRRRFNGFWLSRIEVLPSAIEVAHCCCCGMYIVFANEFWCECREQVGEMRIHCSLYECRFYWGEEDSLVK